MNPLRLLRSSTRALTQTKTPTAKRTYATGPNPDPSAGSSSSSTWMAIAAALALPGGYFLMRDKTGSVPPSERDQPASRKAPSNEGSISWKQEGLDNADTSHPYVNDPGKSVKGEGETETAKLKGTVSSQRPQQ